MPPQFLTQFLNHLKLNTIFQNIFSKKFPYLYNKNFLGKYWMAINRN